MPSFSSSRVEGPEQYEEREAVSPWVGDLAFTAWSSWRSRGRFSRSEADEETGSAAVVRDGWPKEALGATDAKAEAICVISGRKSMVLLPNQCDGIDGMSVRKAETQQQGCRDREKNQQHPYVLLHAFRHVRDLLLTTNLLYTREIPQPSDIMLTANSNSR